MIHVLISHTDPDGWVSASLVKLYLQHKYKGDTIHCFAYTYGQSTTTIEDYIDSIDDYLIYMTDITLPDEFMSKYAAHIWYMDHHKSAVEHTASWKDHLYKNDTTITLSGYKDNSGNQAKQVAACELVWHIFYPTVPINRFVRLVGRYDIWDLSDESLDLITWLNLHPTDKEHNTTPYLESWFEDLYREEHLQAALDEGKIARSWQAKFDAKSSMRYTAVVQMFGRTIGLANINETDSQYFDAVTAAYPEIEGYLTFTYSISKGNWTFGCYTREGCTTDFNALDFIQNFKSLPLDIISMGGHKDACGMVVRGDIRPILDQISK